MSYPDLIKLTPLMEITSGRSDIVVGLIDGPVAIDHPAFATSKIREVPGRAVVCAQVAGAACQHGTFVAGILAAQRNSYAPAICPDCTVLVRPIFEENAEKNGGMPSATPEDLAGAILDCIHAGARILNISAAIVRPSLTSECPLKDALDWAAKRGAIIVAAAGNQGAVGSTVITHHPWVIPVVAYDNQGRPMRQSNMSGSIGRRGLGAPGDRITSLGASGQPLTSGGTSAAAPFVTGALALLWSQIPDVTAAAIKFAVTNAMSTRRNTVVPPLLDAWATYRLLLATNTRGK
ncbi:peptidase S8 [Burkholderia stagnalis]|uniref:S8 family serine peptidase n=1 Tax=Burkholderia stagnalis TaxID=1503054 RepID=UPI000F5AFAC6|nr:S8 family serine peptidase [Burkholderia stagnalis]RQQ25977.1 peptidase S8 [Burkholderia stagnalis]RQY48843.1 peptidase S8 [Burkholderia stagnalis]